MYTTESSVAFNMPGIKRHAYCKHQAPGEHPLMIISLKVQESMERENQARLLHPWVFPGKNTGVGCHFLLQEIFLTLELNPGLPHCRQTLYHLTHQGSKKTLLWNIYGIQKNSTDEPICQKGMETQMYRTDLWTQRGMEKVGQIENVVLTYLQYVCKTDRQQEAAI